jgi:voltage-dependent calcium channel alpha-2/delta-3
VVGYQFQYSALQALFQNTTFTCDISNKQQAGSSNKQDNCYKHCGDDSWACYLIDNHGYVVVAEDETDVGKFFGEVRGPIMSSLVKEGVFERIRIFDYQAVCSKKALVKNAGNILFTVSTFPIMLITIK